MKKDFSFNKKHPILFNLLLIAITFFVICYCALVAADITINKNMVPFDTRSAFQTSGFRLGTPAITTRGAKEELMGDIVEMIDTVLSNPESEAVIKAVHEKVNSTMSNYPMFAY